MPTGSPYGSLVAAAKTSIAGTRAAMPDVPAREVWIKADAGNAGTVYFGDVTVTSAGGGNVFTQLKAGDGIVLQITNVNLLGYCVGSAATQIFYTGVLK